MIPIFLIFKNSFLRLLVLDCIAQSSLNFNLNYGLEAIIYIIYNYPFRSVVKGAKPSSLPLFAAMQLLSVINSSRSWPIRLALI